MTYTFTIREFNKESQLNLYRECLSDGEWRYKFGLLIEDLDIENYLRSMVLTEYESVVRLLIYENSNLKGFCHVHICNPISRRCIMSGGIKPKLVGTGIGVYIACVVVDHLFRDLNMNKVCCKVYSHNATSFRILSRLGFLLEGIAREHEYDEMNRKFVDVHFFGLLCKEYPNAFAQKILGRVKYEYAAE